MTPSSSKDPIGDALLDLFQHRCIRVSPICAERADIVHEISGRRRPNWNRPDNRVTTCMCCHSWIHYVKGNTAEVQELVRQRRDITMQQLDISWEDVERCFTNQDER